MRLVQIGIRTPIKPNLDVWRLQMKILVVGSAGHNKGSASAIKSTVQSLKEFSKNVYLLTAFPEFDSSQCEVETFGYPTQLAGRFAYIRKMLGILLCFILAVIYRLSKADIDRIADVDRIGLLQPYGRADIVVFCTTDVISDTYGTTMLIQSLKDIALCVLLKKPVVLNATQIGPFRKGVGGKMSLLLTRLVLNKVNLITVRDQFSARSIHIMNIAGPSIYITADPAFLLQPASLERTKSILEQEGISDVKPFVGINASALIYRHWKGANLEERLENFLKLISKIIIYIVEELNATVILVPHVFERRTKNDDRIINRKIRQRIGHNGNIKFITREYEPEELKGIIGQLDLLVSTRMHPMIHAISMHTPVVGIDYTFKATELMKRAGQQEYVCHVTTVTSKELESRIDKAYRNRDKIRKTLSTKSKILKKHASLNAKLIADLFQSR